MDVHKMGSIDKIDKEEICKVLLGAIQEEFGGDRIKGHGRVIALLKIFV